MTYISITCPSNSNKIVGDSIIFKVVPNGGAPSGINYNLNIYKRLQNQTIDTLIQTFNNIAVNTEVDYTYTIPSEDIGITNYPVTIDYICPDGTTKLSRTDGCQFTITDQPVPLSVTLVINPATITYGESTTFTAYPIGGTGAYSYLWHNLPKDCVGTNSATVFCTPSNLGIYDDIYVTLNDGIANADSNYVTLTVLQPPCSITVTNPNTGTVFRKGKTKNITWTYTGNVGSYVKIDLLKAGNLLKTISSSTSNDGSYTWKIPYIATGTDYQIKITSTSNNSCYGISDKFTIK